MTLKQRMDAVWNENYCCCPNHLCRWNEAAIGYSKFMETLGLCWTKGKRMVSRKVARFVQRNIK